MCAGSDNEPSHSVQASANTDPCPPLRDTLHRAPRLHAQTSAFTKSTASLAGGTFFNHVYPSTSEITFTPTKVVEGFFSSVLKMFHKSGNVVAPVLAITLNQV